MNKSQAKKKILEKLSERGSVFAPSQPGRFLNILMHDLGLNSPSDSSQSKRKLVTEALESLADEKKIDLNRVGQQIVGMSKVQSERRDPAGHSAEYRRQSAHATTAEGRHLPSTLPNHMVGPLQVRTDPARIKHKAQPGTVPTQRDAEESEAVVVAEPATEAPETSAQSIYKTGDHFH